MAHHASPNSKGTLSRTLLLSGVTVLLALILAAAVLYRMENPPAAREAALEPLPTQPAPTWPEPVVTANGQPGSVLFMDSYTIAPASSKAAAKQVAATCGEERLTNGQLQIYYLNAIRTYQLEEHDQVPDYSKPLDQQICPLEDGKLSWQHYFLLRAVELWQKELVMLSAAQEPRIIKEEAYKPNETDDLHGKYVSKDLPVNDFLYADQPCYKPNAMHQSYLDGMEEQLDALAKQRGYDGLSDYVKQVFGPGVTAQMLVEAAQSYNFSYMFFTEESYDISVTDEEIDGFLKKQKSSSDGYTVDLRHVLLVPDGAQTAQDGTVTATEEQWADCAEEAQSLLQSWKQDYLSSLIGENHSFGQLANQESMDLGSKANGGLYQSIRPGQLIDELDSWCFDEERKAEDTAIIRSKLGYHIVFFCGSNNDARQEARQALTWQKQQKLLQSRLEETEVTVHYSAVRLWADCGAQTVLPVDVLYPDVAHERFPEAMVYFQQDYMYTPYGGSYVGRGGCGITTMAMLATYMTDTIYTPAMLATAYPEYHDASGTRGELFRFIPAELGFYMDDITSDIKDVIAALEKGQRVVSLQHLGHFTSGGHYLLLQQYYEDTDTFQVRDSNIYNYRKLSGHRVDYFTRSDILSGSVNFYIMQKKITTISACSRCGDQGAPEALLNEDYLCEKCLAAMTRRDAFLTLMGTR